MQYEETPVTVLNMKENKVYFPLWVQRITGAESGSSYTVYQTNISGVVVLKRKESK